MDLKRFSLLLIAKNLSEGKYFQQLLNEQVFQNSYFEATLTDSLIHALEILRKQSFDLILVDLELKDSQGLETFILLSKGAQNTPIVILTEVLEDAIALEALSHGAQDYLEKSHANAITLPRVIRYAMERHHLQETLRTLSFTDELTGLYNRRGFIALTQQQMELAKRLKKGSFLFFIDLDHLKEVNDTYGHQEGDYALKSAAHCLRLTFRNSDVIGRIGGDEFAVFIIGVNRESEQPIKQHLRDILRNYNAKKTHTYDLTLSMGAAYKDPGHSVSVEDLIASADKDLYINKREKHRMHP